MKISSTLYSIQQGIKNIWRNKMFSLASIATMSACIFLFGLFFIIVTNFNSMVKDAEENVAITVFFDKGISKEQTKKIGEDIKKRAEVKSCKYVSAKESWDSYKKRYFEGHEEYADVFENDNPLKNAAHYEVYLNDVSMQEHLVKHVQALDGVRKVQHSKDVAGTLSAFNKFIGYISIGIIVILLGVAVFLISNTVTVGISVRKEEIAIMRLIGATDFLIRAPFIVEGIIIGLIGAIIPLALLYSLYGNIVTYVGKQFNVIENILNFVSEKQVFVTLVPVALILGVGIGLFGSMITIRKHLKV
ncbi:cell division transport system permease protein [Lachnospiraceae bacterium C7]|nr:cell division transport system permease protein [Lachnospiraceae bacterium C7]